MLYYSAADNNNLSLIKENVRLQYFICLVIISDFSILVYYPRVLEVLHNRLGVINAQKSDIFRKSFLIQFVTCYIFIEAINQSRICHSDTDTYSSSLLRYLLSYQFKAMIMVRMTSFGESQILSMDLPFVASSVMTNFSGIGRLLTFAA